MIEVQQVERSSSRPTPYTTKSGLRIGCMYQPPRQELTPEGEFIQAVMLGDTRSVFPHRETVWMGLYMVAMIALISAIAVVFQ